MDASDSSQDFQVLHVLSKIQPGETLCSDYTVVPHDHWSSGFKRWWSGDSRQKTVSLVETTVAQLTQASPAEKSQLSWEMIQKVQDGIMNLSITYEKDEDVRKTLLQCVKQLSTILPPSEKEETEFSCPSESSDSETLLDPLPILLPDDNTEDCEAPKDNSIPPKPSILLEISASVPEATSLPSLLLAPSEAPLDPSTPLTPPSPPPLPPKTAPIDIESGKKKDPHALRNRFPWKKESKCNI